MASASEAGARVSTRRTPGRLAAGGVEAETSNDKAQLFQGTVATASLADLISCTRRALHGLAGARAGLQPMSSDSVS